ncbi:MAG: AEC family transporter [Lachnospiraceae bacterium]|jgi:predicted permease|nr:AEC family transporter [Lachnospiraceae bacterium]
MEHLLVAVNAVVPFLIYMAFGYGAKRAGLMEEALARRINSVVFQAFYPVMMFYNLYQNKGVRFSAGRLILTGVLGELILILLLLLIVPALVRDNARRGVLIQAVYRSNFVLFAMPLTENVFGKAGLVTASMMVAIIVPFYNVTAVIILEHFRGGRPDFAQLLKKVLVNPMILGTLIGIPFLLFDIRLPECVEKPISQFSALTTPLALFILGATLRFSSLEKNLRPIMAALSAKLIVIPAVMLAVSVVIGMEPLERFVLLSMFATPTAAASFPMAQNMGGDGELAGELVVCSTTVSVITIFFWILILKSTGLI